MPSSRDRCNCCNVVRGDSPKYKLHVVQLPDMISKLNRMSPYVQIEKGMFVCSKCCKKANDIPLNNNQDNTPSSNNRLNEDISESVFEHTCQMDENNNIINNDQIDIDENFRHLSLEIENQENDDYSSSDFYDESSENSQDDVSENETNDEQEKHRERKRVDEILINIPKAEPSHQRCVVCRQYFKNRDTKQRTKVVNRESIIECFIETGILMKQDSRCCLDHVDENTNRIKIDEMRKIRPVRQKVNLKNDEVAALLLGLRERAKNDSIFAQFRSPYLPSNRLCLRTCGLTNNQFIQVHEYLTTMNESNSRTRSQALAVYLFWLTTGCSQEIIASYFGIESRDAEEGSPQRVVSRLCEQIRSALSEKFLTDNIGPNCRKREEFLARNSTFATAFFLNKNEEKLVLIGDGTYVYCQKSFNNEFQRSTYSMQKNRHLVKPFVLCTCDGFIVDIYGFYSATMNDASIMQQILENNPNLINKVDKSNCLLKEGDIMVFDRGFRDVITISENEYKLQVKIPHFLPKNQKQFTTEQANESRLVTKVRWVIEAVNSQIKQKYRALDSVVQNKSIPHLMSDFKIAGALVNLFCERLNSDGENAMNIANKMFANRNRSNETRDIVESHGLHRKSQFEDVEEKEFADFPKLSLETLKSEIAFGSFQLKLGPSYITEFFKKHGTFRLYAKNQISNLNSSKIVTTRVQSRHSSSKSYRVYVKYSPQLINSASENYTAIEGWYCECKNGARTLGACCHVCSIVFFLSYGRYQESLPAPAEHLNSVLKSNKVNGTNESNITQQTTKDSQKKTKNRKRKEMVSSNSECNTSNESDSNETMRRKENTNRARSSKRLRTNNSNFQSNSSNSSIFGQIEIKFRYKPRTITNSIKIADLL